MKLVESLKKRLLMAIWNHTPTCTEMSRLASQSLDRPLSLRIRCQIRLHYLICIWCRRYQKHLEFLHGAAPRMSDELESTAARGLSTEARERIAQRLRDEGRD